MLPVQLRALIDRRLAEALALARRHPRRVSAGVLLGLGGFAATAFGTAPLAGGQLPVAQQVLTETVPVVVPLITEVARALQPLIAAGVQRPSEQAIRDTM